MKLFLTILTLATIGGCIVVPARHPYCGDPVYVESYHVHDDCCGHYWYHGNWYYTRGHRHGPGCGHVWVENRWVFSIHD